MDNLYTCEICNKTFTSKLALGPHRRLSHDPTYVKPPNGHKGKPAWNRGLTVDSDPRVKNYSDTLKTRIATGEISYSFSGVPRTQEVKDKISSTLRNSTTCIPPKGGRKLFNIIDSFGNEVWLQSTFELKVSDDLNKNSIRWTRPKCLRYLASDGKLRRYYPDFYLVDYDVYLDPKNDFLIIKDQDKIDRVITEHGIKLLVLNSTQLDWCNINKLIVEMIGG